MKKRLIINGHEIAGRMPLFQRWGRDAIRDGRKTQTRRIIDPQPDGMDDWRRYESVLSDGKAKYGKPGEIRVMREPLRVGCLGSSAYYADDGDLVLINQQFIPWRWKRDTLSHMFMPTEYGRTLCLIESIRVERLQDISEEDAIAEGSQTPCDQLPKSCQGGTWTERQQFSRIWDSINAKKSPWSNNDWVIVTGFKEIE